MAKTALHRRSAVKKSNTVAALLYMSSLFFLIPQVFYFSTGGKSASAVTDKRVKLDLNKQLCEHAGVF